MIMLYMHHTPLKEDIALLRCSLILARAAITTFIGLIRVKLLQGCDHVQPRKRADKDAQGQLF